MNCLKIKFIKLNPFWRGDLTAEQIKDEYDQIEKRIVIKHDQGCKYLYLGQSHYHDVDCILIIECNQFKNKKKNIKKVVIMKKTKRDPAGHGNNAISPITGRQNFELNREGGNGCTNPNWGTGRQGDANPDTQKELTAIQKYENRIAEKN